MSVNFDSSQHKLIKAIIIGVLLSLVFLIIMTCLSTLIIYFLPTIPYSALPYMMVAVEGISVIPGAYIASAIMKSRGLLTGAICGGIVFLVLLAFSMCSADGSLTILTLIRAVLLIVLGILGGIMGVNRKEKIRIK